MDIVTLSLARKKAKQYTDTVIGNLPKGVVYKGSVNYYADLPNNAELGECYTVLYKGTTGTELSGIEYVWGENTATSTNEWTAFGPDLSEYVQFDDYATYEKGGVIKTNSAFSSAINNNGYLQPTINTYQEYIEKSNSSFIGKGTLENVIAGKGLETANNKVTSISSSSTNTQYASALATYNYVNTIVGDINSILDDINR